MFSMGFRQDIFGARMGAPLDLNFPAPQFPNMSDFAAPAAAPSPAPAPGPAPAPSPSPAPAPAPQPDFFPAYYPYYYPVPGYPSRSAYQVQSAPVTKVEVPAPSIPSAVWIGGGVLAAALIAVAAFK